MTLSSLCKDFDIYRHTHIQRVCGTFTDIYHEHTSEYKGHLKYDRNT